MSQVKFPHLSSWFPYTIIISILFISFFPSLFGAFLNWDDNYSILENPAVIGGLSFSNLYTIFFQPVSGLYPPPLTTLSFAIEYQIFGANSFIFHLTNLLLHIAVVLLIYRLALRLGLAWQAGLIAAILFGIHPLHVESVAWITERKDVLYALFYVLAVYCYVKYVEVKQWKVFGLVVVLGILSMLAKPMAISLPLILLLVDWYRGRKFEWSLFIEKIPLTVILLILSLPSLWFKKLLHPIDASFIVGKAILVWLWSLVFYLWKFVFPFQLSPIYSIDQPVSLDNFTYRLVILTVIALGFCIINLRRDRLFIFAVVYYFLSIVFLLQTHEPVELKSVVADRYMYLPSLGFCLWGAYKFWQWIEILKVKGNGQQWLAYGFGMIVVITLISKTIMQCHVWNNSLHFWNTVIAQSSDKYFAYGNRGNIYNAQGQHDLAIVDYTQAIALNPQYALGYNNRGIAYVSLTQDDKALADFNAAIKADPTFANPYLNRSTILAKRKNFILALKQAQKAQSLGGQVPADYIEWLKQQAVNDVNVKKNGKQN